MWVGLATSLEEIFLSNGTKIEPELDGSVVVWEAKTGWPPKEGDVWFFSSEYGVQSFVWRDSRWQITDGADNN